VEIVASFLFFLLQHIHPLFIHPYFIGGHFCTTSVKCGFVPNKIDRMVYDVRFIHAFRRISVLTQFFRVTGAMAAFISN